MACLITARERQDEEEHPLASESSQELHLPEQRGPDRGDPEAGMMESMSLI